MLSVKKQLAITLCFMKDQGSFSTIANAFALAHCTVSMVFRKICDIITNVLGSRYRKLPNTIEETKELIHCIENKYGFPKAFG